MYVLHTDSLCKSRVAHLQYGNRRPAAEVSTQHLSTRHQTATDARLPMAGQAAPHEPPASASRLRVPPRGRRLRSMSTEPFAGAAHPAHRVGSDSFGEPGAAADRDG